MKIIEPSYEILTPIDGDNILKFLEKCARICYKSENKITKDSAQKLIKNIIKRGHESVLEHVSLSIKFICNRGFSHELVRHRLASFSQESSRYCNYSKNRFDTGIIVIKPYNFDNWEYDISRANWILAMEDAEEKYIMLTDVGVKSEDARGVLPIDLKTEIIMSCNLREMRHILKLRCNKAAHPSMRQLMIPLLNELKSLIPVIFDDIEGDL